MIRALGLIALLLLALAGCSTSLTVQEQCTVEAKKFREQTAAGTSDPDSLLPDLAERIARPRFGGR